MISSGILPGWSKEKVEAIELVVYSVKNLQFFTAWYLALMTSVCFISLSLETDGMACCLAKVGQNWLKMIIISM